MALHRMSHRQVYDVISQAYNKYHGGNMSDIELADAIQGTQDRFCVYKVSHCYE